MNDGNLDGYQAETAAIAVLTSFRALKSAVQTVWTLFAIVVGAIVVIVGFAIRLLVALIVWGSILMLVGGAAYALLPASASSKEVFAAFSTTATAAQNALNPVLEDVRTIVNCSLKPLALIWNTFIRIPLAIVRTVIIFIADCNPNYPDCLSDFPVPGDCVPCSQTAFAWAGRAMRGSRVFADLEIARERVTEMRRVRANTTLSDWKKLGEYTRLAQDLKPREVMRDLFDDLCDIMGDVTDLLLNILDLYATYQADFLEFLLTFWNVVSGFDASYLEILVQWLVIQFVKEIPLFQCLIDVNNFNPEDINSYIPQPKYMVQCVCPHAYKGAPFPYFGPVAPWVPGLNPDNREFAPFDIPAAFLGCVCPLNGSTSIFNILWNCSQIQTLIDWFNSAWAFITQVWAGYIYGIEQLIRGLETVGRGLENAINELRNRLNEIADWFRDVPRDEIGRAMVRERMRRARRQPLITDEIREDARRKANQDQIARAHVDEKIAEVQSMRPQFVNSAYERMRTIRLTNPAEHVPHHAGEGRTAQLLDGLRAHPFMKPMHERVAADLGPEAGEHARKMQAGVQCLLGTIRSALWGNMTITQIVDEMTSPCVRDAYRAIKDLHAIWKQKHAPSDLSERVRCVSESMRVAWFKPDQFSALAHHLIANGHNQTAVRFGLADAANHAQFVRDALKSDAELDRMVAEARHELRQLHHELTQAPNEQLKSMDEKDATIHIGIGITSTGFLFSILSEGVGSFGGALLGFGVSVIGAVAAAAAAAIPLTLGIAFHVASGFFNNIALAAQGKPLDFDGGISLFVGRTVALVGQSYDTGYTQAMLEQWADEIADDIAATGEYLGIYALGKLLGMRAPFVDANGKLTESPGDYFFDAGPGAPVDQKCGDNADCDTYPCRHEQDIADPCVIENGNCVLGICTIQPCTTNADCDDGVKCMGPAPYYDNECTTPAACFNAPGVCARYCSSPTDCVPYGGGTCANRFNPAEECSFFQIGYSCRKGTCIAWPLVAPYVVKSLELDVTVDPKCEELGIDDSGLRYWEWSSAFKEYGISVRLFFTWDHVRLIWECYKVGYYVFRLLVAVVVNGWRVTWAAVFLQIVGSVFWFVPPGFLGGAMKIGLAGNYLSSTLEWIRDAMGSVGGYLDGWPWIVGWIGGELNWISEFRPVGTELVCVGAIIAPLGIATFWTVVLFLLFTMLASAGFFLWCWYILRALFRFVRFVVRLTLLFSRALAVEAQNRRLAELHMLPGAEMADGARAIVAANAGVVGRAAASTARGAMDLALGVEQPELRDLSGRAVIPLDEDLIVKKEE